MKKLITLTLVLAIAAGAIFWFFSPEQRVKRKTNRILDAFTVEGGEGNIGAASNSLFADSLFAENVKIESADLPMLSSIPGLKVAKTFHQSTIINGMQSIRRFCSKLAHDTANVDYQKINSTTHQISFDHDLLLELKRPASSSSSLQLRTTFTFAKTADGLRLTKALLKKR